MTSIAARRSCHRSPGSELVPRPPKSRWPSRPTSPRRCRRSRPNSRKPPATRPCWHSAPPASSTRRSRMARRSRSCWPPTTKRRPGSRKRAMGVAGTRFTYAIGRLVLWSVQPGVVDEKGEVLRKAGSERIALADPKLAPYGAAAVETMTRLGLHRRPAAALRAGREHRADLPVRLHRQCAAGLRGAVAGDGRWPHRKGLGLDRAGQPARADPAGRRAPATGQGQRRGRRAGGLPARRARRARSSASYGYEI